MEHRTERVCVTCPGLGRDGENDRPSPNYYDYRWACEECRPQLRGILNRAPRSFADLDATPGGGHHQRVSGSIEAPLGVRIDVLDEIYTGPAITIPTLPLGPDQDGVLPTARLLAYIASEWLPAWQEAHPREQLPQHPTVANLAAWLEKRLDWACNTLPGLIADHAAWLSALDRRLDRLNGAGPTRPEPVDGVVCRCDRYTLARLKGDVICTAADCNVRMSPDEYERWTKLNAAAAKQAA
jgi:hypothetical protein